jgi:hypothetical protein
MSSRLWILLVVFMMMPVSCKEPAKASKKSGGSQNANPETDSPATRPDPVEEPEEEEEEEDDKDTKKDKCKNKTSDDKDDKDEKDDDEDEGIELRLTGGKTTAKKSKRKSTVASFALLATVNYKDDIESIFSDKCVSCHSGDDKYALDTYTKAKKIKDDILSEVDSGKMPPKNKAPLTSAEKKAIKDWVNDGAPESSSSSSTDDEDEDEDEKDEDDCDDDDNNGSAADWDDLLKSKEVEKCKDDGKIFDRLAEKCHKAKIASFDCSKSGVVAKFKESGINVGTQYEQFISDGYQLDQCGEYNKDPIVLFYKKKEEKEELKLLIKKLCKKGSAACDN